MILKTALLIGVSVLAAESNWTKAPTEKATVVAFDRSCVELKLKNGKKLKIKKEGFSGMNLISGTTEVEIHPESLGNAICETSAR